MAIKERINEVLRSCKNPVLIRASMPTSGITTIWQNVDEVSDSSTFARKRLGATLLLGIIQNENVVHNPQF